MSTQNCVSAELPQTGSTKKVNKQLRTHLIRKFQRIEGNIDCCASAYTRVCKQFACLWRDECLALIENDDWQQSGHD